MDWILFLLYRAIWSLAGRGFWGPLQEKRAPLVASFAQCCVSAVFACCCPTVCERLCKDTQWRSPSAITQSTRSLVTLHPQPGPSDHLPPALSTPRHCTLRVWSLAPPALQLPPCACSPALAPPHPGALLPEPAGWVGSHAGLGKPANFSFTPCAAPIPSLTSFEHSLGDGHLLPSVLRYALAALEFTLHFYSHSPIIAY